MRRRRYHHSASSSVQCSNIKVASIQSFRRQHVSTFGHRDERHLSLGSLVSSQVHLLLLDIRDIDSQMPQEAIAVHYPNWSTLFSAIIRDHNIHLIVCSSKKDFIETVIAEIAPEGHLAGDRFLSRLTNHPAIRLVRDAEQINLAFTPSLMHLRAHLANLPERGHKMAKQTTAGEDKGALPSSIAIVGLLDLHRSTNNFSAQGISRTAAVAVDAAAQINVQLRIMEVDRPRNTSEEPTTEDQPSPWSENVPLLNSSIRSGGDSRIWAGRSVAYGTILRSWCRLESSGRTPGTA